MISKKDYIIARTILYIGYLASALVGIGVSAVLISFAYHNPKLFAFLCCFSLFCASVPFLFWFFFDSGYNKLKREIEIYQTDLARKQRTQEEIEADNKLTIEAWNKLNNKK